MKSMKKVLASLLALAMVVTAVPVTNTSAATGVSLNNTTPSVYASKSKNIKVTVGSAWKNVKVKKATVSSSDEDVVRAVKLTNKKVKITGVSAGTAKVTFKVTGKKNGVKTTKTLTATVTVKPVTITAASEGENLTVGSKVSDLFTVKPSGKKLAYTSSDETVATVDEDGTVTAVAAGTATIYASSKYAEEAASVEVTVVEDTAELSTVTQTASNAFTATFTQDASSTIAAGDITVATADGTLELPVLSISYSADGLTAAVTLSGNFTDATEYVITCGDVALSLTASVGNVSSVVITTVSAEQNVETNIGFTLYDASGIDVTPSISLDTTCTVNIDGDYSAADTDRASDASITMDTIGATATVIVIYNSNASGAEDVTGTGTITCTDPTATYGTKLFAQVYNEADINSNSGCAKFYLEYSSSAVYVNENGSTDWVFFCATDDNGLGIDYDSYSVESSNDDVAGASLITDSGRYAQISVSGNEAGAATIVVTATKNGVDSYYTIPVVVNEVLEAYKMTIGVTMSTMSNSPDEDYSGWVYGSLYDKNGTWVSGTFSFEVTTSNAQDKGFVLDESTGEYTAHGATAGTYTIKVTGADDYGNTFTKNISVAVKALPEAATTSTTGAAMTYQIEIDNTTVDVNGYGYDSSYLTTNRLYATCNGLFAGYVRLKDGEVTIAGGEVYATDATSLSSVTTGVKFGTTIYAGGILVGDGDDDYTEIDSDGEKLFNAISGSAVVYTPTNNFDVQTIAKSGTYTVVYNLTYDDGSTTTKTKTFTVKNSRTIPTVTVTSRTVESLTVSDIIKNLKTDVDMNHLEGDNVSIKGLYDSSYTAITDADLTDSKVTVKYVLVEDGDWSFYVSINTTFKTE